MGVTYPDYAFICSIYGVWYNYFTKLSRGNIL
jgi:hypothetical protein